MAAMGQVEPVVEGEVCGSFAPISAVGTATT
jgi:hypothetical protein